MPTSRLDAFDNCRELWRECQRWLGDIEATRLAHNQAFTEAMLEQYREFFDSVESSPLNASQARAVVNGERSCWCWRERAAVKPRCWWRERAGCWRGRSRGRSNFAAGIPPGGAEMDERIRERLASDDITARTFHSLALHIIQQGSKKVPTISKLESDTAARHALLLKSWQKQCQEKKAQAKGWRLWLEEEMGWQLPEGDFWQDKKVQRRMASRLDRWVSLMRMHGGSQAEMIAGAPEAVRDLFSKRVKLMSPLMKDWKAALKAENAVDFSGLIHQAVNILDKGRFVSPWKHILVDEFQDISPQRASLLAALRRQNSQTTLFAVGDDWQAIYRFSGAQLSLTTAFNHYFGEGDCCALDTTYRFNGRIGEIANGFIQQNPHQLSKPLNSLTAGDKRPSRC